MTAHRFLSLNIVSTFSMMLGNIDGKIFESPPQTIIPFSVGAVTIAFMIMLCIVTANVLTGLSVNQVDYFMMKADLSRVQKMADVCHWLNASLEIKNITVEKMKRKSTRDILWHTICSFFLDAQGRNENQKKWKYRGTILLHNGDTEKDVKISQWVFDKAKIIIDKIQEKENEDKKYRKLIGNQKHLKMKSQNDKQRYRSQLNYINKKFEAQTKQIETSRLQFEQCLTFVSSTMEKMQTIQNNQEVIISNQQTQLEKQNEQLKLQVEASKKKESQ